MNNKKIGIIGAGSFGTALTNMLVEKNVSMLMYIRNSEKIKNYLSQKQIGNLKLTDKIELTNDLERIGKECNVIFPVIPSSNFRQLMKDISPYLKPYHIIIHGIKGFDYTKVENETIIMPHDIKTMSEVIREESSVIKIGCLAGPNLSVELNDHKPAATVIATHFDEVSNTAISLLKNNRFLLYGSSDLKGAEIAGSLKNIIAIGAGAIYGLNFGENAKALFISRGLVEMIHIGQKLGGKLQTFLGLSGVGDLIATCSSKLSRNYTVGYRLAQNESIETIQNSMNEVAEGIKTIYIIDKLAKSLNIKLPITQTLRRVIDMELTVSQAHQYLMKFPYMMELDFLFKNENDDEGI